MKNRDFFKDYSASFLRQNSILNLISKNDEKLLFEKHIFDSMSIEKFLKNIKSKKIQNFWI
ncbi:class I SAM-dependent methyltransferase [bacterium]|nr:class I SAM-dependent methyltransferase [bacterium]